MYDKLFRVKNGIAQIGFTAEQLEMLLTVLRKCTDVPPNFDWILLAFEAAAVAVNKDMQIR